MLVHVEQTAWCGSLMFHVRTLSENILFCVVAVGCRRRLRKLLR